MLEISKSALKAKLLEYLRGVEETGEEIVVTDNGRPVVKISALRAKIPAADAFAKVRGRVVYHEDIMEPTADEWPEP